MAWTQLKNAINSAIKANDNQEITGQVLNNTLNTIVNNIGKYATFAGIATPSASPGVFEGPVVYFANTAGTYPNFGNITVNANQIVALYNIDGLWESYEIANNTITTSRIADGAVITAKLADGAVTSEKTNFIAQELSESETLVPSVNVVRTVINAEAEERNSQDVIIATQLSNEIERAKDMELGISTKLNDEIKRATEAENNLQEQITSEADARDLAINAEAQARTQNDQLLSQAISAEQERAEAAEQAIIYDVSARNNGAVFESLSALLNNANLSTLIPASVRCGGMSIRFIQGSEQSSDNKYVQYRLMNQSFSTTISDWQGVDDVPTAFSQNLVESGGVKQELNKKVVIKCGKNLYNPDTNTLGYFIDNLGNLRQNDSYSVTDYIPVTAGDYHLSDRYERPINIEATKINLYDAEYTMLYTVDGGSADLTIPSGISYMRVTLFTSSPDVQIEMGDTRTSYEPYSPIWGYALNIPDGSVTESKLSDNSVGTAKLKDSSVTEAKIADKSVSLEKTDFSASVNIVVPADIHNKKYHNNANCNLYGSNDAYIATGLTYVNPNTTYYFKNFSKASDIRARFVEFFNSGKERINIQEYKASVLSPDTASFVIATFLKETSGSDTLDDIYVGEEDLSEYKPYKVQIQGSLINPTTFDDGSILTNALKNKCVTKEKLADDIHIDATPARFGVISSAMSTVAVGAVLNTPFIRGYKNISLIVQIDSAFEEVKFGVDKDSFYQIAFILDSTNVKFVSSTASTEVWTEAHGLTLGSNTVALVTKNIDRDSAKITIFNDQGEYWEKSFRYGNNGGLPYLLNSGQSSITAKIGFELRDINEKIWLFGDSYFAYDGGDRWPYYLINAGYTRNLLSARGGDAPNSALSSFINLLATGARPSFVVWCMGMNAASDTGDTPNTAWLNPTTSFLSLCEQYGITPIISTIPTVPSRNHANINDWVKSHDYRYIDFAAAVEVNDSNYWKNWGTSKAMLSSDEVHPTAYGAKALYQQVIKDFPEIMVTC